MDLRPKHPAFYGVVCIDLDGVLLEFSSDLACFGNPMKGAVDAVELFREQGYKIIVYTSRPDVLKLRILAHLRKHYIRVDGINGSNVSGELAAKPVADIYIDDRGFRFNSWENDMPTIQKILKFAREGRG